MNKKLEQVLKMDEEHTEALQESAINLDTANKGRESLLKSDSSSQELALNSHGNKQKPVTRKRRTREQISTSKKIKCKRIITNNKMKLERCSSWKHIVVVEDSLGHIKFHSALSMLRTKTISKPLLFQICKEVVEKFQSVTHRPRMHNKKMETKFMCPICGEIFWKKIFLSCHLKEKHCADHYHCPQCKRSFVGKQSFEIHLLIHQNSKNCNLEKTFCCEICSEKFTRSQFKRHKCVHKNENQPKRKRYNNEHAIELHHNYATKMRYKCDLCKKKYKNDRLLRSHLYTHFKSQTNHTDSDPLLLTENNCSGLSHINHTDQHPLISTENHSRGLTQLDHTVAHPHLLISTMNDSSGLSQINHTDLNPLISTENDSRGLSHVNHADSNLQIAENDSCGLFQMNDINSLSLISAENNYCRTSQTNHPDSYLLVSAENYSCGSTQTNHTDSHQLISTRNDSCSSSQTNNIYSYSPILTVNDTHGSFQTNHPFSSSVISIENDPCWSSQTNSTDLDTTMQYNNGLLTGNNVSFKNNTTDIVSHGLALMDHTYCFATLLTNNHDTNTPLSSNNMYSHSQDMSNDLHQLPLKTNTESHPQLPPVRTNLQSDKQTKGSNSYPTLSVKSTDSHQLSLTGSTDSHQLTGSTDSHQLPLTGSTDSHQLSLTESTDSHQLPLTRNTDLHQLPLTRSTDSHQLPLKRSTDSHQMPLKRSTDSHQMPLKRSTDSHQLPLTRNTDSHQLPLTRSTDSHQLPLKRNTDSNQLPLKKSTDSHQLPLTMSTGSHQQPLTRSTGSHQQPLTWSTDSHQPLLTESSESHQLPLTKSTDSHQLSLTERPESHQLSLTRSTDSHQLSLTRNTDSHQLSLTRSTDSHQLQLTRNTDLHQLSLTGSPESHLLSLTGSPESHQLSLTGSPESHLLSLTGSTDKSKDFHQTVNKEEKCENKMEVCVDNIIGLKDKNITLNDKGSVVAAQDKEPVCDTIGVDITMRTDNQITGAIIKQEKMDNELTRDKETVDIMKQGTLDDERTCDSEDGCIRITAVRTIDKMIFDMKQETQDCERTCETEDGNKRTDKRTFDKMMCDNGAIIIKQEKTDDGLTCNVETVDIAHERMCKTMDVNIIRTDERTFDKMMCDTGALFIKQEKTDHELTCNVENADKRMCKIKDVNIIRTDERIDKTMCNTNFDVEQERTDEKLTLEIGGVQNIKQGRTDDGLSNNIPVVHIEIIRQITDDEIILNTGVHNKEQEKTDCDVESIDIVTLKGKNNEISYNPEEMMVNISNEHKRGQINSNGNKAVLTMQNKLLLTMQNKALLTMQNKDLFYKEPVSKETDEWNIKRSSYLTLKSRKTQNDIQDFNKIFMIVPITDPNGVEVYNVYKGHVDPIECAKPINYMYCGFCKKAIIRTKFVDFSNHSEICMCGPKFESTQNEQGKLKTASHQKCRNETKIQCLEKSKTIGLDSIKNTTINKEKQNYDIKNSSFKQKGDCRPISITKHVQPEIKSDNTQSHSVFDVQKGDCRPVSISKPVQPETKSDNTQNHSVFDNYQLIPMPFYTNGKGPKPCAMVKNINHVISSENHPKLTHELMLRNQSTSEGSFKEKTVALHGSRTRLTPSVDTFRSQKTATDTFGKKGTYPTQQDVVDKSAIRSSISPVNQKLLVLSKPYEKKIKLNRKERKERRKQKDLDSILTTINSSVKVRITNTPYPPHDHAPVIEDNSSIPTTCSFCGKVYTGRGNLYDHIFTMHFPQDSR